jgi:hypothetical protein
VTTFNIENIGTLELGALEPGMVVSALTDGAVEAVGLSPLPPSIACPRHIDDRDIADGALEAVTHAPVPTTVHTGCYGPHIDDDALEGVAGYVLSPTLSPYLCQQTIRMTNGCVTDDAALENAAGPEQPVRLPLTMQSFCKRIDAPDIEDDALEAESANPTWTTPMTGCRTSFDDAALENASMMAAQPSINMGCSSTYGRMCSRIDDAALEGAAQGALAPLTAPNLFTGQCCIRIDAGHVDADTVEDGALELSASPKPLPMTIIRTPAGCTM